MTTPRKVRWLIAHEPQELFVRTARAFSQELEKRIPGQIAIEIVTVPEYIKEHKGSKNLQTILDENLDKQGVAVEALFDALRDDIQMSQTQVSVVGYKDRAFHALDLPFLFDNHEHVSRVLEGPIGEEICANLEKVSDVKGLAFTYSGGYRVVGSNHKIEDLADLASQKVIVSNRGPRADTFEAVGVEPVVVSPHLWGGYDTVPEGGSANAIETTYLRFKGTHILKTNHSIFMTTILTNKAFWESLTAEQQTAFEESAKITARIERQWAIADADKFEQDCAINGVEITELSAEDTAMMKHKSRYTYLKFDAENNRSDLIKRIRLS
jgi:TRAP-type C4-dicarboxylate transport system substrate-binding protein